MTRGPAREAGAGEGPAREPDEGSARDGSAEPKHGGGRAAGTVAMLAGLTVASRLAGFARILVFSWAVGATVLGEVYHAANFVPNLIFEIIAGGALASLVVPLLIAPAERGDRPAVSAAVSAMLTWVLTLLIPVAVLVAVAAEPLVRLIAREASPEAVAVGTDMLRVFAPQLPLYGIGIVLTGVLQTYRRFAWPVLAPLLSSVTVMTAYAGFALVAGRASDVGTVSRAEVLILSGGTTAAVAVLTLCLLIPLRGVGLRPRPRWRFAEAGPVRRLAAAGAVTVGAQQLGIGFAIALAYGGPDGTVVLYALAQTIFLLPWAVLAVPVATSAYPALAAAGAAGDDGAFRRTLAPAVRSMLLLCCFGVAALLVLAEPVAVVLAAVTNGRPPAGVIAAGIAGFAPGLLGYGLFALLSRALYARGAAGAAASATALGWACVAGASLVLAAGWPPADRVVALAVANSAGLTVLGGALLVAVRRRAGASALAGAGRSLLVGVLAGTAAGLAGLGVKWLIWGSGTPGVAGAVSQGMLCGVAVGAVYLVVAVALDRRDVRPLVAQVTRRRSGPARWLRPRGRGDEDQPEQPVRREEAVR